MTDNKRKTNWIAIISLFSLSVSIVSLIMTQYPQIKPWNYNLLSKAQSGDAQSQLKLAHYYFSIGDYNNSLYWYQTLAETSNMYQSMAINNEAYIYITNDEEYRTALQDYYCDVLSLFLEAYTKGDNSAGFNICEMVESLPVAFIQDRYSEAHDIYAQYRDQKETIFNAGEWIFDHYETLTVKSDKWKNGGYTMRTEAEGDDVFLYISELDHCHSNGIGDVDLYFKVHVYKKTKDKRLLYYYSYPDFE